MERFGAAYLNLVKKKHKKKRKLFVFLKIFFFLRFLKILMISDNHDDVDNDDYDWDDKNYDVE